MSDNNADRTSTVGASAKATKMTDADSRSAQRDIGWAVYAMREGERVRRALWRTEKCKDMFLVLVPGSTFVVTRDRPMGRACPEMIGKEISYHTHVDIKTSSGDVIPWLCSQSDLLASDWELA
jgi:hypothetical protein